jgi:homoserine dehydrogenase
MGNGPRHEGITVTSGVAAMDKKSIGIGLIGLGVVAGQVARVLADKADDLAEKVGCPLVLRKVKVLPPDLSRPQAKGMSARLFTTDADEFFGEPGIDIVVEAMGGENPALEYLQRAITGGKHVVTSNKEVIAKHGLELLALARQHGVGVQYEASVGGGIPLIAPFKHDLVANNISGIFAIINGTTNYILTRMAREGIDFDTALKKAQELGYAEANPENDIEGIDANYKLAILASLAFQSQVRPQDIYREGISRLTSHDFRYARELGFAIKLLAIAKRSDASIEARVHPVFIPEDSFLAKVEGVYNAIQVEGDLVGKVLFMGEGAGALPTSSAVIADVVSSARKIVLGIGSLSTWKAAKGNRIKPMDEIETQYYVRLNAADQPGVLAQIATVFGKNMISISSALQPESDERTQTAEIVIMTHPAREKAMQQALRELEQLEVVRAISNFIRVEDIEGG